MKPTILLTTLTIGTLAAACAPSAPPATPVPAAPLPAAAPAPEIPVPAPHRAAVAAGTRSATGAPGARYWQQRVRYQIQAELDPVSTELRGAERVVYHNQSPDTLRSIVLNLYQNVFAPGVPRNRYVPVTGGMVLERVAVAGLALQQRTAREIAVATEPRAATPAGYAVQGTLGRIALPAPLLPGDSVTLEIAWRHKIPPAPSFRTGWDEALGGRAFQVAQWYPQIATYDDLRGWDATPYLGDGEFYLEYGDFDVEITVPRGWLVGATGELQNPEQVLSAGARARLASALQVDSTVRVATAADVRAGGPVTWRFRADNVRDFGFATSDRYVWDATRARIPSAGGGSRVVAVHALYRPGAPNWERAARFGQHSLQFFSDLLIPYLWPQLTIAEGPIGGMEYPQLVFIGRPAQEEALYSVIAHEVGHEWFPMMVGSDEAAYAWMDEGFTTFHEALAKSDFYAQPDSASFSGDVDSYLAVAGTEREVPLMRHTDLVSPYGARGVAAYTKPAVMLRGLREVLGDSVVHRAMRLYAQEWLLKHPAPWDFFHTLERVAGRELDAYLLPRWYGTEVVDHAIEAVQQEVGGVTVTVRDQGGVAAPAVVVLTTADGAELRQTIPLERWTGGPRTASVTFRTAAAPARVRLDPERVFADADPSDDQWVPGTR